MSSYAKSDYRLPTAFCTASCKLDWKLMPLNIPELFVVALMIVMLWMFWLFKVFWITVAVVTYGIGPGWKVLPGPF